MRRRRYASGGTMSGYYATDWECDGNQWSGHCNCWCSNRGGPYAIDHYYGAPGAPGSDPSHYGCGQYTNNWDPGSTDENCRHSCQTFCAGFSQQTPQSGGASKRSPRGPKGILKRAGGRSRYGGGGSRSCSQATTPGRCGPPDYPSCVWCAHGGPQGRGQCLHTSDYQSQCGSIGVRPAQPGPQPIPPDYYWVDPGLKRRGGRANNGAGVICDGPSAGIDEFGNNIC